MTKESVTIRRKVWCSLAISFAALFMIFSFCGRYFQSALRDVANFFVGSFGMAFYGMMIAVIVCCSFLLAGRTIRIPKKYVAHFFLLFVEIVMLVHLFSTIYFCYEDGQIVISFADYTKTVYNHYAIPTFGGVVFGVITFGLQKVITIYATAVLLFGLLVWSVISIGFFFNSYFTGKLNLTETTVKPEVAPVVSPEVTEPVNDVKEDSTSEAYKILFANQEHTIAPEADSTHVYGTAQQSTLDTLYTPSSRKEAEEILFNPNPTSAYFDSSDTKEGDTEELGASAYFNSSSQQQTANDDDDWRITRSEPAERTQPDPQPQKTVEQRNRPDIVIEDGGWVTSSDNSKRVDVTDVVVDESSPVQQQPAPQQQPTWQEPTAQPQQPTWQEPAWQEPQQTVPNESDLTFDYEDSAEQTQTNIGNYEEPTPIQSTYTSEQSRTISDVPQKPAPQPQQSYAPTSQPATEQTSSYDKYGESELIPVKTETRVDGGVQEGIEFVSKQELRDREKVFKYPKYVNPPAALLNDATIIEDDGEYERNMAAAAIVNKLAVFGIRVESAGQVVGPSVTRYMFKVLSQKTRMDEFSRCAQDLKACLEASGEIRIEAPIPGTNLVGIEVANKVRTTVTLRTVLESKTYKEKKGNLVFVVGQQISGEMVVDDLSKLPHLLVAGTTGSGKSVFLHSLITSLMFRYGPEHLRFIMVDPKLVEFGRYNGIPHMLTTETIINANDALAAMDYLVAEMEARYQLLRQSGVANIADYNAKINTKYQQRLPYLVLVVDELADLMTFSKKSFETKLQRLAQKARAAGIHLVLATQRPDVQTISGTIKTNFPCRIALKVSSATDSGTILNGGGAEKLLGYGDLLYMHPSRSELVRIQGTYLSDEEISAFVEFVKSQNTAYYDAEISKKIFVSQQEPEEDTTQVERADSKEDKLDPYCKRALRFWLERQGGRASIASIVRSLKIGFNRAGRIMDSLQKLHYVEELAPNDTSSKPLHVLVTLDQLDELFPDQDDEY